MVVTLDSRGGLSSAVHQRDLDSARQNISIDLSGASTKYPLFAIIEIGDDLQEDNSVLVKRQAAGRYLFRGKNIEDVQGLLVKIGVDYALTKQVRGLSILVPALGEVK